MKIGTKVRFNGYYPHKRDDLGKVMTVASDPWYCMGIEVVKLDGRNGGYAVDGLEAVQYEF